MDAIQMNKIIHWTRASKAKVPTDDFSWLLKGEIRRIKV